MLALISLILVIVGCANWLTIGLLQFDFVAGLFGSQSNIFSRIVYVIIGIAAISLTINIIKNKGKIAFNFKKLSFKKAEPAAQMETSRDLSKENSSHPSNSNYKDHKTEQSEAQNNTNNTNTTPKQENGNNHANNNFKNISEQLSKRHQENNNK